MTRKTSVERFLDEVSIGDMARVNFTTGGESGRYYGKVITLTENCVTIKNEEELEFFEALAYPAVLEIPYHRIWSYSIKKKDGTEYYL